MELKEWRETQSNGQKKRKELFLREYVNHGGNITQTCRAIGINRCTFYRWLKHKRFKAQFEEIRLEPVENVESALYKQALEGNVTAQIFYLKHNYPERYSEKKGGEQPNKTEAELEEIREELREFMDFVSTGKNE